tara:strand:+ start:1371 stop:1520 length:150 start_codon:yes stop_codon:yes gene_type:complete
MDRAARLVFVLSDKRVVSIQLRYLFVSVTIALNVSVDRGGIAAQAIRNL